MKSVLLDTNVIAELMRDRPAPNVVAFLSAQFDAWLSVITLHELEFGWQLLPLGARRAALRDTLTTVMSGYADRILPVSRKPRRGPPSCESKPDAQGASCIWLMPCSRERSWRRIL